MAKDTLEGTAPQRSQPRRVSRGDLIFRRKAVDGSSAKSVKRGAELSATTTNAAQALGIRALMA